MAKTMTIQDLRNMVDGHNGEDLISTLSDELIHRIFSFLDVKTVVKTCVLSSRWVNIWTTLPFLNFGSYENLRYAEYYNQQRFEFVPKFLSKRDQYSVTSNVQIYNLPYPMEQQILNYASSHNVKHLYLHSHRPFRDSKLSLSFPVLETLHLSKSELPLKYWSLPSLTVLHLEGTLTDYVEKPYDFKDDKPLVFQGLHNLKKLTLTEDGRFLEDTVVVMIKYPNLAHLSISWSSAQRCKFVILTPNLSSLKYSSTCMPVLCAEGGFPSLKEVNFYLYGYGHGENIDKQKVEKLNSLLSQFQGIEYLALSWGMIQVLAVYSKSWPSPFNNLKTLHMQFPYKNGSHVAKYLLNSSPGMKIFIEEDGQITNFNPEEDIVSCDDFGYHVQKTNKQTASSVKVDEAVLYRVSRVRPPPMLLREFFKERYKFQKSASLSLWEGHHVCTDHLKLLHCIMKKQPETFEHFAPRTGTVSTVGLSTLCNAIQALCEVSSLPASTVTHFRDLFTDLEGWGFKTTWLLNILNNINETSPACMPQR